MRRGTSPYCCTCRGWERCYWAIDAVVMQRLFTVERKALPKDDNEEQLRASTKKLLEVAERERVALTVFGHDGSQWKSLKKSPEFYQ